jgi:hypothetical protein
MRHSSKKTAYLSPRRPERPPEKVMQLHARNSLSFVLLFVLLGVAVVVVVVVVVVVAAVVVVVLVEQRQCLLA